MIDKLAKLLATENIVVEHRKAVTASFDTKNRVLTLPMWKDISAALETLLVGHEVGHALYTPDDGWNSILKIKKQICNVVEDPRIERKMKLKYPGLRRDFYEGYKELFEKDFFNIKGKNVERMGFLDRLNIHFKIGLFVKVNFSAEEQIFVVDIENTTTWNEVEDITDRLFKFLKEKEEEKKFTTSDMSAADDADDMNSDETDSDEFYDDSESNDDDIESGNYESYGDGDGKYTSETQEALEANLCEKLIDPLSKPITYVNVRDIDYKNALYSFSELFSMFEADEMAFREGAKRVSSQEKINDAITRKNLIRWNKFLNSNGKVVSYLVKEFEMKKAADNYVKRREGKTGVINTNKLHAYKIINDIFRKTTIVPESKNHGLVFLVDFSGSMASNIQGTIEQVLCLVLFCRKINIPHRVYAFTTQDVPESIRHEPDLDEDFVVPPRRNLKTEVGDIVLSGKEKLFELFTEKMRNNQFSRMGQYLLNFAEGEHIRHGRSFGLSFHSADNVQWYHSCIRLSSTPLNTSLIFARNIIKDFKKQTNAQIINCVVLTDGESDPSSYYDGAYDPHHQHRTRTLKFDRQYTTIVRDIQTKQEISLKQPKLSFFRGRRQTEYDRHTDVFVDFLKNRCNVDLICYRIENSNKQIKRTISQQISDIVLLEESYKKMQKQKYFHMKGLMKFDDYFIISGGIDLDTEDSLLGEGTFQSKNSLARAFIKANQRRGISRVMLSKFIQKIAA